MTALKLAYLTPALALAVIVTTIPGADLVLAAAWHAVDPTRLDSHWAIVVGFILTLTGSLAWFLAKGGRFEDWGPR